MPRIRSIKPEFWTSGQVLECSTNARLMFIGLWNFCDDCGRHPLKEKQIKAEIFPADDFTIETIRGLLQELSQNDLITTYVVDNNEYLQINGWHHQRIDKPQPAKYPEPFQEHSKNDPRTFPPDRIGKDRIGKDGNGEDIKGDGEKSPPAPKTVLCVPLVDKSEYKITEDQISDWVEAYPGIDVLQELRKLRQWNIANPKNQKTRAGVLRHITAWLGRAQDKAPRVGGGEDPKEAARKRLFGEDALEGQATRIG